MPADEVTRGTDVEASRARTGPRHAAPKKPLFTRFHMPAGKAIALAAMPTAVLMGMGFTPTLALADGNDAAPPSNSLTADEYKDCVAALEDAEKGPSESPTPSPSATDGADDEKADDNEADDKGDATEPDPSASGDADQDSGKGAEQGAGSTSSPDSGSDDKAEPAPSASSGAQSQETASGTETPSPSPSESDSGGVLKDLGDAIGGILTGGKAEESPSPTPTPSASASAGEGAGESAAKDASDTVEDTVEKATDAATDTAKDATDAASGAAEDTGKTVDEAADEAAEATEAAEDATASPSPDASESAGTDVDDCPVATDAEGGVDNKVPLPDDPWYLNASSLLLKGASYKGVVEVRTANGTTKKVLKYVISNGTDIGDLHQTVKDEQSGKTYHVQAAQGSTSTIRDGETVMYTESISGNLLGLIPITFDPENPPPLDIPLIYFTKVTVVQAGQFGGTLHIPGLHQYTT
ncbi:hypothetical protein [Streptomyces flaveolus]|uniref:hypothetical protein n=1 Tax=Streptomyces flaveolus TaxID=67297 RepID=UPI00167188D0|nr:hypothetical protein [Streptomyces flaveolus]GGQ50081.1 hypothetical protein GCM10010216_07980 [Streptomyces flaveolus]